MPAAASSPTWFPRLARTADVAAMEALIPASVHSLQASHYSAVERAAALGPVFGVDRQLIADGTYFAVEKDGLLVGCGGWSRRRSGYGGDRGRAGADPLLDPARDPARIRAFFVHPAWARRGIGRSIMDASERAIGRAGFSAVEIIATLAGEPLYAAFGYTVIERPQIPLPAGLSLAVVRMAKRLDRPA